MIQRIKRGFKKIRRFFSRGEWTVRLLSLGRSPETRAKPGLILVQIDGLSRTQMERAIRLGRMPFLKKLLNEHYHLWSFYSGLPSSTPAVQGELFYGIRCAVPAFGFRDYETGEAASMFNPQDALRVEKRLSSSGEGLLKGGGAYSDIYTGEADIASFCTTHLGLGSSFKEANPVALVITFILHEFILVRVMALIEIEIVLAIIDFLKGLIERNNLLKELLFIPSRVAISVLLRELVTAGVIIDAARGMPIIHCNFLGYDEQAHRRGPSSAFAHWTLKGIDNCLKRIWRSAKRSVCRDYEIWFYSDHGQESTMSYEMLYGRKLEEAIIDIFRRIGLRENELHTRSESIQLKRSNLLGGKTLQQLFGQQKQAFRRTHIEITAKGPVAHVYLSGVLDRPKVEQLGQALAREAHIPVVMAANGDKKVWAWISGGRYSLPEETERIIGEDHPFLEDIKEDLIRLVHHQDAGAFVLFGWKPSESPLTFPIENGSHAGFGSEETHGFAGLPERAPLPKNNKSYLRPEDLRSAVLGFLDGDKGYA